MSNYRAIALAIIISVQAPCTLLAQDIPKPALTPEPLKIVPGAPAVVPPTPAPLPAPVPLPTPAPPRVQPLPVTTNVGPIASDTSALQTLQQTLINSSVNTDVVRQQTSNVIAKNAGTSALTIDDRREIEAWVMSFYQVVQKDCSLQLIGLKAQSSRSTKNQAHLNAIGALVALIGGVTVYAPAKTILMGIGISSAGGSNSVIGDLADNQHDRTTLSQQNIEDLRAQYSKSITEYKSIVKEDDKTGAKRFDALIDAQSGCMGLLNVLQTTSGK